MSVPPTRLVAQLYKHYFGNDLPSVAGARNQSYMVPVIIDNWWRSLYIKSQQVPKKPKKGHKTARRYEKKNLFWLLNVKDQENILKKKLSDLLNNTNTENDARAIYLLNIGFNNSTPYKRLTYDNETKKLSGMNPQVVKSLYYWQRFPISLSVGFFVCEQKPMAGLNGEFQQKPKVDFHSVFMRELYTRVFCYGRQCMNPNAERFTTASVDNSCYLEGYDSDDCGEEGGGYGGYDDSDSSECDC